MAPPLVETRSTVKKPAADAKYSRVMKRPSMKHRLASTETPQEKAAPTRTNNRPASRKHGAQISSSHTDDEKKPRNVWTQRRQHQSPTLTTRQQAVRARKSQRVLGTTLRRTIAPCECKWTTAPT